MGCFSFDASNDFGFCIEIVRPNTTAAQLADFEADCLADGGTFMPSGCPEADRACTLVETYDVGNGYTHIYGAGMAASTACSECGSPELDCC